MVSNTENKRNVDAELKGLGLNVRISPNPTTRGILDVDLYNHAKRIVTVQFTESDGYSTELFDMYGNSYELSVYSQSRINQQKGLDDFEICIQAVFDGRGIGAIYNIKNVNVNIDYAKVDVKKNAVHIGTHDGWKLYRSKDKSLYFMKRKKAEGIIEANSIQTIIEKYAISAENTGAHDIDTLKKSFGIDIEFQVDLTLSEKHESIIKELEKHIASKDEHDDKMAKIAVCALRELSPSQRAQILSKVEDYAKDPEKVIDDELNVAM